MHQLLELFALSPGHEEEQFKDRRFKKKKWSFFSGLKQHGYLVNKNLKTLNDLQGPEVCFYTILWAAVIGKKTSTTSQKHGGEYLTSVRPLVVVKLEPLTNEKRSQGLLGILDPNALKIVTNLLSRCYCSVLRLEIKVTYTEVECLSVLRSQWTHHGRVASSWKVPSQRTNSQQESNFPS